MNIDEAIKKMSKRAAAADIGKAVNVREAEELCDVEIAGKASAVNARLGFASTGGMGWLVVPKEGSDVIVLWVSEMLPVVVAVAEPERIVFRGGEKGGLINIAALVEAVNGLIDKFNSHTHQVTTTGTAAAQSGSAMAVATRVQRVRREDIEDELIKH